MLKGLYTAASGMLAQVTKMDVITNNLANASSTGYKRDIASFNLSLAAFQQPPGIQLVSQSLSNSPVLSIKYNTDFSAGSLQKTDNPLELALEGSGFWVVQTPNGTKYTRNGTFSLDSQGQLVTSNGFLVLGKKGGPISLKGEKIEINTLGEVFVDGQFVDALRIADFSPPNVLKKEGNGLFAVIDPTVQENPATGAQVRQGFLENSNVSPVALMAELIETMRGYETYQKAIHLFDETLGKMNNEVGQA